jgi:hypothetical protein
MADSAHQERAPRIAVGWVLAASVFGFAILNTLIPWTVPHIGAREELQSIVIGLFGIEPMLFAIWAAFGPQRAIIRIPLIVLSLILVVVAPGLDASSFKSVERFEFVMLLVAALALFTTTTLILLIPRHFIGWRIERLGEDPESSDGPLQFDTKHLMVLVTLCALALGITFNLKFAPHDPPGLFSGPSFIVFIMAFGSSIIFLLHLPTLAIPIGILMDRPSNTFYLQTLALWFLITLGVGLFWMSQGGMEAAQFPPLIQLGGALVGVAAALPLRWAGLRLVKRNPVLPVEANSESP